MKLKNKNLDYVTDEDWLNEIRNPDYLTANLIKA